MGSERYACEEHCDELLQAQSQLEELQPKYDNLLVAATQVLTGLCESDLKVEHIRALCAELGHPRNEADICACKINRRTYRVEIFACSECPEIRFYTKTATGRRQATCLKTGKDIEDIKVVDPSCPLNY